jgi:lipopolysaccharide export system protein LptA
MIARLAPVVLALLAALATAPAWAQPIDMSSGGPVDVTARDGFEWHENDQTVTASGDARAVRGDVTVLADRLVAHYRKKAAAAQPVAAASTDAVDTDAGSNEIYRLDAVGHVRIVTPTDEAVGDLAVYDIDQAVLVMTGKAMRLTTPQYVMTARDSMEYWSQLHMAVGRGNAVVLATDGRRLSGDVLVGYTTQAAPVAGSPAASAAPPPAAADASGKLQRVEAFGNVEVRTATDTVRGDRGVYVADVGLARVVGNVKVVHGQNVITGPAADVNMKTGIAHVVSDPGRRVQGLIMPNQAQVPGNAPPVKPAGPGGPSR